MISPALPQLPAKEGQERGDRLLRPLGWILPGPPLPGNGLHPHTQISPLLIFPALIEGQSRLQSSPTWRGLSKPFCEGPESNILGFAI